MTKKFLTLGILVIVLGGVFIPASDALALKSSTVAGCSGHADCVKCIQGGGAWADGAGFGEDAVVGDFCRGGTEGDKGSISNAAHEIAGSFVFKAFAKGIGAVLLKISSWTLGISGSIFDFVVKYTVIDMSSNLGGEGLGGSISTAWATLRDIANMFFIFVLLFVAFKAMFSLSFGDVGKNILNIIIVALVINFSLFFSKVLIDASNIVAVGFYNSIAYSNVSTTIGEGATTGDSGINRTITSGYMRLLGLHSLYSPTVLSSANLLNGGTDAANMLVFGIAGSVFMLITAVIFLITGIMFVARFIILTFLMILSPIAFIAIIIPGRGGLFKTWLNALIDQSFFAPLFFALTWVVFKIAAGLQMGTSLLASNNADFAALLGTNPSKSSIALLMNFVLLMGFAIMALVLSKQMASKTAYFTTITGGIGAGAAGGTAWGLRNTVGASGAWLAGKMQAAKGSDNWAKRTGARFLSYTGEKAAKSSFDARNASVPTSVIGDAIRGTVGRTKLGGKIGLNDVNIPSIDIGNKLGGNIIGTAERKGYKERKAESDKRVRERDAAEASEIKLAKTKNNVLEGAKDGAPTTAIDEMEKSLATLSDKETEALVASNRDLLESQNFANKISVKQLEAIVKSDQFSEEDKGRLKNARFREIEDINDADGLAAITKKASGGTLTKDETDAIAKVEKARTRVKALHDSELEMINPNYLDPDRPEGVEFIAQLKGSQVDAINKNNKFTSSQKEKIKTERMRPLMQALSAGKAVEAQNIVRKADIKTKVGYMKPTGTPPVVIATHPDVVPIYTIKMLQRMAAHDDMTDDDISNLRLAILMNPSANADTVKWLKDKDKGMVDFPA